MSSMNTQKVSRNDRCPCGSLLKYKHCCGKKAAAVASASPALSQVVPVRVMEAFRLYEAGHLDDAQAICQQLLVLSSKLPDPIHLIGMVWAKRGDHARALEFFDKAIGIAGNDSMYSNKGLSLQHLGRIAEAETAFKASLRLNPRSGLVHSNYGLLSMNAGRHKEAIDAFEAAIRWQPTLAPAYGNLALCHVALADWKRAEEAARRGLQVNPQEFNAHSALSTICMMRFEFEQAAVHFDAARHADPNSIVLLDNYFRNLVQTNRTTLAREIAGEVHQRTNRLDCRVHELLTIPVLNESNDDIVAWRSRFEGGLDEILAMDRPATVPDVLALYSATIFYLAFHGMNDVKLMRKFARLYEHLVPEVLHTSAHLAATRQRQGVRRIGFFSRNVHDHPVTHCFSALIEFTSQQEGVEAFLISPSGFARSEKEGTYGAFKGTKVTSPAGYREARQLLEDLKLDLIVYTDIGMDPLSYFLASARLAPVQCSVPGHPVTTGITNVDCYFTTKDMEPDDAWAQYSESIVAIENFSRFPELPTVDAAKNPAEFGLPPDFRYYMCPMMLQKMHPEFDEAMLEILKIDPQAVIVLFETKEMPWKGEVLRRLRARTTPALLERVRFLPYVRNRADFIAVLKMAHVVIDPFHFGLGSTSAFIAAAEVPFVSWPGETMRGRVALWLSRIFDMPEVIAASKEQYPELAVSIAKDPELARSVAERIRRHRHRLFQTDIGIREFFESMCRLIDQARLSERSPMQDQVVISA
jgi:predicted O-linked N-acetylglucosamine transferase (SPINDLY family)